jgi:ectoine hydroxylase-related dioxygenase (phytanoyl-CoA dioxygenase family)
VTAEPVFLEPNVAPSNEQVESFRRDGHVCIRGLAQRFEIDAYRPELMRVARTQRLENRPLDERDTYGQAFLQMFNLWMLDERVARFVLAPRFARVAAELMEVDGVRIYHDQALVKEPGGGYTPWHQDQGYWPLDTTDTITMWMPLVDIPAEVGSMTFGSGSHHSGDINAGAISDRSHDVIARLLEQDGVETATYGAMERGDATFHAGWTLHSAGANASELEREVMTIIYVADGTHVTEPSAQQRLDLGWLGGAKPGQLVESAMNPLVWPTDQSKSSNAAAIAAR